MKHAEYRFHKTIYKLRNKGGGGGGGGGGGVAVQY